LRKVLIALVGAAAGLLPASAAAGQPAGAQTCQRWHAVIGADGRRYAVNPDNWGGGSTCMEDYGTQAGFTVESQRAPDDGHVLAYPASSIGCSWGSGAYCTTGWTPEPVSAAKPEETLAMSDTGSLSDVWDFANDMWFWPTGASHPDTELMVYFDEQNLALPNGAVEVTVGGAQYWYKTYTMSNASYSWRYIVFERVTSVESVTRFALAPFFSYARRHGVLSRSDDLQQVSTGFEESRGGTGLQLDDFSLTP